MELLRTEEEKILNLEDFSLVGIPNGIRNKLELGLQNFRQVVQPSYNRYNFNQSHYQLPPQSTNYRINESK